MFHTAFTLVKFQSHALTGVMHKAGYALVDYSEQQLVDCIYSYDTCDREGRNGGHAYRAYEYLKKKSFIKESDHVYTRMVSQFYSC